MNADIRCVGDAASWGMQVAMAGAWHPRSTQTTQLAWPDRKMTHKDRRHPDRRWQAEADSFADMHHPTYFSQSQVAIVRVRHQVSILSAWEKACSHLRTVSLAHGLQVQAAASRLGACCLQRCALSKRIALN